jgi:ADP-L-glycero-D-manno-heptose 6-epimerase
MKYTNIDFNNKNILITGAAGFIGSNIALYFQKYYPNASIVALDIFRSGELFSNGNLKSFGHFKNLIGFKGKVICGDINDDTIIKSLENDYKFDYIFHQAAISDTTINQQDLVIKTNVNAYEKLLKISINHSSHMIYASSAAVYGNSSINSSQNIGDENPNNVYGFSKNMMDNISYEYIKKDLDISIVGLRYFNVYGKNEFFKNSTASTVLQFGHQILSNRNIVLFENSHNIFRDFVYIEDIIQANIKSCEAKKSGVYNVGTSIPRSFQDIANILQDELNSVKECKYIKNPYIKRYQFYTQANIDNTRKYLNYEPKYSLEDGIKDYISYIKDIYNQEVL